MSTLTGAALLHALHRRSGVSLATLERLAAANAFRSLGLDRRQALWAVKGLAKGPELPLLAWAETREIGAEPEVELPLMSLAEHVVVDYQTLRLSLEAHPMSFLRDRLRALRTATCADLASMRDGARISIAGVVLVRQRPGTAKGVVFMTLEDETGVANTVVWAKTLERHRRVVMTARLILIRGRVQRQEGIVHVIAGTLEDKSDWLAALAEGVGRMPNATINSDAVVQPEPASRTSELSADTRARNGRHPRDVRVIPKSRDFH